MNRLLKYVATAALCGLICGCETTSPTGQTASSAYVHAATKFSFPQSVGGLERAKVNKFDRDGKDIGVEYNAPIPLAATVFVYPGPKDFALTPAPKSENVNESEPELKFFSTDRYFVTCRVTYPSSKSADAEPRTDEWMKNL